MTTTINRQLTLLVEGATKKYEIDNFQFEVDLVSALQRMWTEGGRDPSKLVKIREEIEAAWFKGARDLDKLSAMEARVKACMGISIDGRSRYEDMLKFLIKKEGEGQTVEQYAAWCIANPIYAPKFFQIALRPDVLEETWNMAFMGMKIVEPAKSKPKPAGRKFEKLNG